MADMKLEIKNKAKIALEISTLSPSEIERVAKAVEATLQEALDAKADESEIEEIKISLNTKANQTDIETINAALNTKADKTELESLELAEQQRADRLRYYGDANITPSDSSLFTFTLITQEIIDSADSPYDDTYLDTYMVAAANKEISGDIVIPYECNGKKVTAINNANNWESFRDCIYITSMIFPSTIRLIGRSACQGCTFTEITIPGSIKKISQYAFYQSKLSKVIMEEGVEEIGKEAFYSCPILHIEIPRSVISLGERAFSISTPDHEEILAGIKTKKIYYAGTKTEFEALNVGDALLWLATVKCNYIAKSELDDINNNLAAVNTKIPQLTEAVKNGFRIKEHILWEGDTFVFKPNSVCVVFPPDKTMEIYHADGTQLASNVGIIGCICTEVNETEGNFRAPTFYQTSGLLGSSYEASYFYFQEGAYVKYTGTDGYCRVVCNEPVEIEGDE